MEDNRLWLLIARHLSGEITADQSNELQEILRTHPQRQYLFDILHSYFDLSDDGESDKDSAADPLYEEQLQKILSFDTKDEEPLAFVAIPEDKRPISRRMWRYAFAVAGCILLVVVGYHFIGKQNISDSQNKPAKSNEIISKSGFHKTSDL